MDVITPGEMVAVAVAVVVGTATALEKSTVGAVVYPLPGLVIVTAVMLPVFGSTVAVACRAGAVAGEGDESVGEHLRAVGPVRVGPEVMGHLRLVGGTESHHRSPDPERGRCQHYGCGQCQDHDYY